MDIAKRKKFGQVAIALNHMTEDDLNTIALRKGISKRMLGQLCLEGKRIDDDDLAEIIAEQYSCPFEDLDNRKDIKDESVTDFFDNDMILKNRVFPFSLEDGHLIVAVSDPADFIRIIDELELAVEHKVSFAVVSAKKLSTLLKQTEMSRESLDIPADMELLIVRESEKGDYEVSVDTISSEESPVVKLVDSTILDAINKNVSDIHIESSEQGLIIRYRIDGMLHQVVDPIKLGDQNAVISRLKVMSELDISEKRIPQDGRFKLKVKGRYVDFRISILPSIFGENAVIRILDQARMTSMVGRLAIDSLNLPASEHTRLMRQIRAPYGMFLMTGPTGSGKTTTLYRALSEVNDTNVKIITIEDPVEYQIPGITQIPVNKKKGLTFSAGLRSILRHDPDKILVGEIRDSETAEIALQSALTGHQVFTTVHANSSLEVINRFMYLGIDPYNLVSALNCIVAQRLVRTLCTCKKPVSSKKDMGFSLTGLPSFDGEVRIYKPAGCQRCNGIGYYGRKAVLEHIELDSTMKEMIINRAPVSQLEKRALEQGTVFLRQAVLYEVTQGNTTLDEADRITFADRGQAE